MKNKKPPFEVANEMIGYVAGILELVRKLSATPFLSINQVLQRSNRIKNDPWFFGNRADHAFFRAGYGCAKR